LHSERRNGKLHAVMNPQSNVEQASIEDLPRLVELLSMATGNQPDGFGDLSTLVDGVKAALEQPELCRIFVVREQGRILAMATLVTTVSTAEGGLVAMLDDLVVDPACRNQRIGSRLLQAVRRHAAAQGLLRITVMPEHLSAASRRFFQQRGFADSEMIALHFSPAAPHGS